MGRIFPVGYRCRIDRDNEQSVFRAIRTGSAKTVGMAPILSTVRHFSNNVTSLADVPLLVGKAMGGTSAFASQAGRSTVLTELTLFARLW